MGFRAHAKPVLKRALGLPAAQRMGYWVTFWMVGNLLFK